MFENKKIKVVIVIGALIIIALAILVGWQFFVLRKAHSTFENYYAFRGCAQLISRTDNYGICKTYSGQVIKIVKFNNKWFLDNDLPWGCIGHLCFGL